MSKPSRYSDAEISKLISDGFWKTTISTLWDQNAENRPSSQAICDPRAGLTWAEARQWTDQMALNLIGLGIDRDGVVVVQLPNCIELHLLRVACEKAGLLCAPVTVNMREKEMRHILRFTEARAIAIPWKYNKFDHLKLVETMRSDLPYLKHILLLSDKVPQGKRSVRRLFREPPAGGLNDASLLARRRYRPAEVSIINHTTGTTGRPKFVEYPAAANAAWAEGQVPVLHITGADVIAAFAPAARGPSLPAYYDAPWAGAKIVMHPWDGPDGALRAMEKHRVTVACLVPTQLAKMVEQFKAGAYDLSSLRLWYSAGAIIPPSLVKEAEERIGGAVISDYGAVDFGGLILPAMDDPRHVRMHTVGKPRFGTEIKIVDDHDVEVSPGKMGEIWGKGPSCASGYFKDPQATLECWNSDGWFAMGDLGSLDENGNLMIVGRKKNVIIRGGQNIHPGELEGLLISHPKIKEAAVVRMPDELMGEKACAYVALHPGEAMAFEDMISFLTQQHIAAFKLPERLEILENLPLISDQKIDRSTLEKDIAGKLATKSLQ
ncbi:MAG: AMP-binding protein [Desulfobacterales bacterium]|nr:AMP-binding protein [Desulfobacterales bacterium]